jgi:hypothetical protein
MMIAMSFVPAFWGFTIVKEKEISAKHLQLVSGVRCVPTSPVLHFSPTVFCHFCAGQYSSVLVVIVDMGFRLFPSGVLPRNGDSVCF